MAARKQNSALKTEVDPKTSKPKGTGRRKPLNQLNDLTAKEWIAETVSVWTQKGLGKGHKDVVTDPS